MFEVRTHTGITLHDPLFVLRPCPLCLLHYFQCGSLQGPPRKMELSCRHRRYNSVLFVFTQTSKG